jgi:thioredoxin-like negative regulator of GroEL
MKIIKFGADWCVACKTLQPILEEMIPSNPNHEFIFKNVDNEEDADLATTYKIKSLPTTVLVNHRDEEIYRFVGVKTKETIQAYIDDLS